jgi:hypothetical protein
MCSTFLWSTKNYINFVSIIKFYCLEISGCREEQHEKIFYFIIVDFYLLYLFG